MKFTDRQLILLNFVARATERDANGKLTRFFVPMSHFYYVDFRGEQISTSISGAGDAACFKGLERRGLVKRPQTNLPNKYCYELTEEGQIVLADNWQLFEPAPQAASDE